MYPYVAGGTGLSACTPPWASEDGKLIANLQNPETRAKIKAEMQNPHTEWENLCQLATPQGVLVLGITKPENRAVRGQAAERDRHDDEQAVGRRGDGSAHLGASAHRHGVLPDERGQREAEPRAAVDEVRDGRRRRRSRQRARRSRIRERTATFPRILGQYVRDEKVMPLEDAVRKATSAVATRLSIPDRGVLREGFFADIAVFDPATIADHSTFEQPHQLSVGVKYVFVNGTLVVRDGRHTGAKAGRALRGPGSR